MTVDGVGVYGPRMRSVVHAMCVCVPSLPLVRPHASTYYTVFAYERLHTRGLGADWRLEQHRDRWESG